MLIKRFGIVNFPIPPSGRVSAECRRSERRGVWRRAASSVGLWWQGIWFIEVAPRLGRAYNKQREYQQCA
jgi:hypothetical protein